MAKAALPKLAPLPAGRDLLPAGPANWYAIARSGDLDRGTGLPVHFCHTVVIAGARIIPGSAPSTGFQLRASTAPTLAGMPPIAGTARAVGVARLRLGTPVHHGNLCICFSSMPLAPAVIPGKCAHVRRSGGQYVGRTGLTTAGVITMTLVPGTRMSAPTMTPPRSRWSRSAAGGRPLAAATIRPPGGC
jgi:hypothetical protein